jgi:hypothetical protein
VRKSDKENTRLAALWIVKHQVNGNRGGYTKVGATIGVDNLNEDKVKYQVKVLRGNSNFMQQLIARVQHERAVEKKVAGKNKLLKGVPGCWAKRGPRTVLEAARPGSRVQNPS